MRHYPLVQVSACPDGPEHSVAGWDGKAGPLGKKMSEAKLIRLREIRYERTKVSRGSMLWSATTMCISLALGKVSAVGSRYDDFFSFHLYRAHQDQENVGDSELEHGSGTGGR
jgi:hypothetical protein